MRKFRIHELIQPKKRGAFDTSPTARAFWHSIAPQVTWKSRPGLALLKEPGFYGPADRIGTRYFLSRHVSLTPTDKAVKLTDNVLIQRSSQRVFACPGRRHPGPGPRWVRIGISAPLSIDTFQRSLTAYLDVRYISRRVTGRPLRNRFSGGRRSRWGSDVEGNPCYHSFISIQSLVSCVWCRSNLSPPLRPLGRLWLPRHARHRVARFSARGWLHE